MNECVIPLTVSEPDAIPLSVDPRQPAPQPRYQEKSVTVTQNGEMTVTPDEGYDALASVGIETEVPVPVIEPLIVGNDGVYTSQEGGFNPVTVNVNATTEVPRPWVRPADWPNLDLVDKTQVNTIYTTFFADGTQSNYYINGAAGIYEVKEIHLGSDGTETVIANIPSVYETGGRIRVDLSGLSNGIHLLKIRSDYICCAMQQYKSYYYTTKILETLILAPDSGYTGSTGNSNDSANGSSAYTQYIKMVGGVVTRGSFASAFPATDGADVRKVELENCSGSNWNLEYPFRYCSSLQSLVLKNCRFTANKLPNFYFCEKLYQLDLSGVDFSNATGTGGFGNTFGWTLTEYSGLENVAVSHSYNGCNRLTHQSLLNIMNKLATVLTATTLTLGSVNTAKLTPEEIAIATQKGWTVA